MYRVLSPGKKAYVILSATMDYKTPKRDGYFTFDSIPQAAAYRLSNVIRSAKKAGFTVQIVYSENNMGLELSKN